MTHIRFNKSILVGALLLLCSNAYSIQGLFRSLPFKPIQKSYVNSDIKKLTKEIDALEKKYAENQNDENLRKALNSKKEELKQALEKKQAFGRSAPTDNSTSNKGESDNALLDNKDNPMDEFCQREREEREREEREREEREREAREEREEIKEKQALWLNRYSDIDLTNYEADTSNINSQHVALALATMAAGYSVFKRPASFIRPIINKLPGFRGLMPSIKEIEKMDASLKNEWVKKLPNHRNILFLQKRYVAEQKTKAENCPVLIYNIKAAYTPKLEELKKHMPKNLKELFFGQKNSN